MEAQMLTVYIGHDDEAVGPVDEGAAGWKLHSFCTRHRSFRHPDSLKVEVSQDRIGRVKDRTLKRKLECGLAFWLGYFEHGDCIWFRSDSPPAGVEFQWDGVRYAGLLVWYGKTSWLQATSLAERTEAADRFLARYTDWANGDMYWYRIDDDQGQTLDSSGPWYGSELDVMFRDIASEVGDQDFQVTGDPDTEFEPQLRRAVSQRLVTAAGR
jgi:hypothetical protein